MAVREAKVIRTGRGRHLQAKDTTAVAASFDKRAANVKRLALVS